MLIEFSVSNFYSIKDTQTLSMLEGSSLRQKEGVIRHTIPSGITAIPNLLTSSVIYGANASGKSKLFDALYFMRWFVQNSEKEMQPGDKIDYFKPFLLDANTSKLPSSFDIQVIINGIRYHYGFMLTNERIEYEFLDVYLTSRKTKGFERSFNHQTSGYDWVINGSYIKHKNKAQLKQETLSNMLFLSMAVKRNVEALEPIFNWFKENIFLLEGFKEISSHQTVDYLADDNKKKTILRYLYDADIGITDIAVERSKFSEDDELFTKSPFELKADVKKKFLENAEKIRIKTAHLMNDRKTPVFIDFEDESHGTNKLFSFIGYIIDALENGKLLFIDELDSSLHRNLLVALIKLFHNPGLNSKGAQLIFTTHNTSLLQEEGLFHRDQIWLVDKDKEGATIVTSLLSFNPRKGEVIEKSYLSGRYGGVPSLGNFDEL